jgi:hypothetical protein
MIGRRMLQSRILIVGICFLWANLVWPNENQSALKLKLIDNYKAASYLQAVNDRMLLIQNKKSTTKINDSKFCGIQASDASMYMQIVKSKIDQNFESIKEEELLDHIIYFSKEIDPKCATECFCEFYFDLNEKLDQMDAKKVTYKINKSYKDLYKKEKKVNCLNVYKNFCKSDLFKEIEKDFKENYSLK